MSGVSKKRVTTLDGDQTSAGSAGTRYVRVIWCEAVTERGYCVPSYVCSNFSTLASARPLFASPSPVSP